MAASAELRPPDTSGRDNDATWLSTRQAADRLGITPRTLYRLIDTDGLPAYQIGRVIRLRDDDVTRWLQSRRIRPGDLSHLYPPGDATL